jgi:carboxypeptidase C (cathepsin A)
VLLDRVTARQYEAGHMMYPHKPSLKKLKADITAFIEGKEPSPRSGPGRAESAKQ